MSDKKYRRRRKRRRIEEKKTTLRREVGVWLQKRVNKTSERMNGKVR